MRSRGWTATVPGVVVPLDRPGWIPEDIGEDWDPDPYAYQTEEELMPAGGPHGQLLAYILEMVRHILAARGLIFLLDTFMLYRDTRGIKRRIAPDLLLMPYRSPVPAAYDLDVETPPLLVVEVTSPKSHAKDREANVSFYQRLGIPAYLVIDAITPDAQPRGQIELYLWRGVAGRLRRVSPDENDGFSLPEIGLRVWADGTQIRFSDLDTGKELLDAGEAYQARSEAEELAQKERRARSEAEERTWEERKARERAEAHAAALEKRLRDLGLLE